MKKLFGILAVTVGLLFSVNMMYAQHGEGKKGNHDFRTKTVMIADKLEFSDAQKEQLNDLNSKYAADDYDKKEYRKEFRSIMTEEQKQKALEMRRAHGRKGKPGTTSSK